MIVMKFGGTSVESAEAIERVAKIVASRRDGLPLVVVVYAVVMGGAALLATLGDANGALALRWIGFVLASLFVAGAVVLLLLLGWERIGREEE